MTLVYIDTETTGLSYRRHGVIEVAWAIEDGPIKTLVLSHSHLLKDASPKALEINRYYERGLDKAKTATLDEVEGLLDDLEGATLLGANVRFDARMLAKSFALSEDPELWNYRLFEFGSWAAGRLRLNQTMGMSTLEAYLTKHGHEFPLPDHSAAGDVHSMREIHRILLKDY